GYAARPVAVIEEVGERSRFTRGAALPVGLPDYGQFRRPRQRRRTNQHGIDDTEDSGARTDPERQGQNGDCREAAVGDEQPRGVADIQCKHGGSPLLCRHSSIGCAKEIAFSDGCGDGTLAAISRWRYTPDMSSSPKWSATDALAE